MFRCKTIMYPRWISGTKWLWGCEKCRHIIAAPFYKFCPFCGRKVPKYVDMKFDTRTGEMWAITFRQITGHGYSGKDEVFLRTENGFDLKKKIYEWLNEEKQS